jgi:hypothetical protein
MMLGPRRAPSSPPETGFEVWEEVVNKLIHRFAGFDHEHDPARFLEQADHFRDRMRAKDTGAFCFLIEEFIHLGDGAVESGHSESVVVHVQNEVLAHHGQTNYGNISFRFHKMYLSRSRARYLSLDDPPEHFCPSANSTAPVATTEREPGRA